MFNHTISHTHTCFNFRFFDFSFLVFDFLRHRAVNGERCEVRVDVQYSSRESPLGPLMSYGGIDGLLLLRITYIYTRYQVKRSYLLFVPCIVTPRGALTAPDSSWSTRPQPRRCASVVSCDVVMVCLKVTWSKMYRRGPHFWSACSMFWLMFFCFVFCVPHKYRTGHRPPTTDCRS